MCVCFRPSLTVLCPTMPPHWRTKVPWSPHSTRSSGRTTAMYGHTFHIFIHVNIIYCKYLTTQYLSILSCLSATIYQWLLYFYKPLIIFFFFFFFLDYGFVWQLHCTVVQYFKYCCSLSWHYWCTINPKCKMYYSCRGSYDVTVCPCFWFSVLRSCWSQCVTSCLSFTGAASRCCSVSRYSSCQSSCGASCPSARPETPTPPAASRPCCWAFTTW